MDTQEPTLDESIQQVMQTLPPVIRDYLSAGKYTEVAKGLITKYGLHVDQGGILEREIMLLLMGIENPTEFINALIEEAKLDAKVVENIVKDVNDQIFAPLKEAEMKSDTTEPEPSHFHLENKIPHPVPAPVRNEIHHPPLGPAAAVTAPAPAITPVEAPKLLAEEKLLEDHEEPHLDVRDKVQAPTQEVVAPTGSVGGINLIPFPPKKIVPPPHPLPEATEGTAEKPISPTPPKVPPPPVKPYSVDPYREPIE